MEVFRKTDDKGRTWRIMDDGPIGYPILCIEQMRGSIDNPWWDMVYDPQKIFTSLDEAKAELEKLCAE